METLLLAPVPSEETPAGIGQPGYYRQARLECGVFIDQLQRRFGAPPRGASFRIELNEQGVGRYLLVSIAFDPEIVEAVEYAYGVEDALPTHWDEVSRDHLTGLGGSED